MYNIQQFRVDNLLHTLFNNISSKSVLNVFLPQLIPLLSLLIIVLVLGGLILLIRRVISFKISLNEPSILLELTPPSNVEQSALKTEQLSTLLHSLGESMSIKDRLLGRKPRFSLEIVSSHDEGIRYMLRTRAKNANTIHKALLSYLPSVSIKSVEDYLPENLDTLNHSAILEFRLAKHFAIPQANDFLTSDYGRAIASQSALRVLMKQDTTTIKKVSNEFNLSEYEQHLLLTCDRGEALIIADQNHVAVKVVASEKEHPLLTTDPREIYV